MFPSLVGGHSAGGSHGFSSSFKKSHASRTGGGSHFSSGGHVVAPVVTVTKTCATCGASHGSQSFSSFGGSSQSSHGSGASLCGGGPCYSSKPLGYGK